MMMIQHICGLIVMCAFTLMVTVFFVALTGMIMYGIYRFIKDDY